MRQSKSLLPPLLVLLGLLCVATLCGGEVTRGRPKPPAGGPPPYSNRYKKKGSEEELPADKIDALEYAEGFLGNQKFWKAIKVYHQILVGLRISAVFR
jgi:hypothetical protein